MIEHPAFTVEPWAVRETALDLDRLAQTESVFALANGHIGLRANLDEGEPFGLPGTYLDGFYEVRPLPYAEAGYGYPEDGQTVVNVTNGKIIRLLVEDEPFDVRYGELRSPRARARPARRRAAARPPSGSRRPGGASGSPRRGSCRSRSGRSRRSPTRSSRSTAVCRSSCSPSWSPTRRPPRCRAIRAPRRRSPRRSSAEFNAAGGDWRRCSCIRPRRAGSRSAAAMDHVIDGPDEPRDVDRRAIEDLARADDHGHPGAGKPLRIIKFLAYGWSAQRIVPAVRDQVAAAWPRREHTGWDGLLEKQRAYLDGSGTAPTSSSTATRSSSRRSGSRCSTRSRRARAGAAARSPPRA